MDLAMVGLGKMGSNMATRLLRGGHRVVAYDLDEPAIQGAEKAGAEGARTLDEVVSKLEPPRVVWVMVPSGDPTSSTTPLSDSPTLSLIEGHTQANAGQVSRYSFTSSYPSRSIASGERMPCSTWS